eukprot:6408346-Alexandrium_andersonii.AAC.1
MEEYGASGLCHLRRVHRRGGPLDFGPRDQTRTTPRSSGGTTPCSSTSSTKRTHVDLAATSEYARGADAHALDNLDACPTNWCGEYHAAPWPTFAPECTPPPPRPTRKYEGGKANA